MNINRRGFLAFLPSLGAIPFIGSEITRSKDKIEIFQPEEMPGRGGGGYSSDFDLRKSVDIYQGGRRVASAYITEVNSEMKGIDVSTKDSDFIQYRPGYRETTIRATLLPF